MHHSVLPLIRYCGAKVKAVYRWTILSSAEVGTRTSQPNAALHDARVGNRPVRQAHLTAADLPGDVCPNAARQTRQPSTPPRSAGKPALNPPIPHLRPAPETSDRLPISHSPGHRHLPATHRQLLATPPWEQNDQSENCWPGRLMGDSPDTRIHTGDDFQLPGSACSLHRVSYC